MTTAGHLPAIRDHHLVVDDDELAHRTNITRQTHPCKKLSHPVLSATAPWEHDGEDRRVYIYGTVLYDRERDLFRMWYMRYPDRVLYATSEDGIHWHRPNLNLLTFNGSQANNILPITFHSPSLVYDPRYPENPYRMLGKSKLSTGTGYCVAHSPDGLQWTLYDHNPILTGGDTCTLTLDPVTGEYLTFHKCYHEYHGHKRRLVYLSTSEDLQTWSEPGLVMAPDEVDDQQTRLENGQFSEFYNMSAFPCGNQWLGFITHFRYSGASSEISPGQSPHDGPIDVQLVHSRDGRTWSRCEDRSPVIPNGPHSYDAGCILGVANQPVLVGQEHWLYYTAITTPHGGALPEKQITIARAAWRQNGWCALSAGSNGGQIETIPRSPVGDQLCVNVDATRGELKVALLDADGKSISNYTVEDCIPISTDSVNLTVHWRNCEHLPNARPIRLRFELKNAHLFSYQFCQS